MGKVEFKEGTQEQYDAETPDQNIFYKITDTDDVYLGQVKLSSEISLQNLLTQLNNLEESVYNLEHPFYLFSGYTVENVLNIIDVGEASNYWSVGDVTEPITLNGTVGIYEFENESYRAMIIGFDHNMEKETGYCHSMTLQFGQNDDGVNIVFTDSFYSSNDSSDGFRMNTTNTNSGGWEASYMRNTICPQFLEALPNRLQDIIGTTVKYTDNYGYYSSDDESHVTATEDKIFLPACLEVLSSASYVNTYEADYQERYAWYTKNDSNGARIRYRHSDPNSTATWWLRSPGRRYTQFQTIGIDGTNGERADTYCNDSLGFAPAFTIIGGG